MTHASRLMLLVVLGALGAPFAAELPVLVPEGPRLDYRIRNTLPGNDLDRYVVERRGRLVIELGDEALQGGVYLGPYPFEAGESDYDHIRFRVRVPLEDGTGRLPIRYLLNKLINANQWPEGQGTDPPTMTAAYRLDLWRAGDGAPEYLGLYGNRVSFRLGKTSIHRMITVVEGPLVTRLTSDAPGRVTIAWRTDLPARGEVELLGPAGSTMWPGGEPTRRHEITVTGLEPGGRYRYRVRCRPPEGEETTVTSAYEFRAAPPAGQGPVTFAFAADSREGYGGNVQRYMGCNLASLERIAIDAYRRGAQLLLFGGDLVNGDTSDRSDFRLQLRGWKQACEGFWRTRPVYPAMGNHERLVNAYRDDRGSLVLLDRWPYATESAEAVFAQEFHNPTNGPAPADPRRPPYRENVYSFTFGPVRFIVFNNNYWWSLESSLPRWGGSPEGYVLDDQLRWIEAELERASAADEVRFVVLFAQEPAFPCGGHLHDAMWWNGDDRVRAYQREGDEVVPAGPGIITVRNRLWRAVATCPKVAAVLAGDEHAYVRTLITGTTPVGDPEVDDTDGDGVLDGASPVAAFRYPTWQIISGNAGAPYYHREPTPWAVETYSSQLGYCLFHAEGDRLSLTAWSLTGQRLDHVDDLLAVKR